MTKGKENSFTLHRISTRDKSSDLYRRLETEENRLYYYGHLGDFTPTPEGALSPWDANINGVGPFFYRDWHKWVTMEGVYDEEEVKEFLTTMVPILSVDEDEEGFGVIGMVKDKVVEITTSSLNTQFGISPPLRHEMGHVDGMRAWYHDPNFIVKAIMDAEYLEPGWSHEMENSY